MNDNPTPSTKLDFEVIDHVAYLTLNGPPKNEMSSVFFRDFATIALDTLPSLPVSGLVIQGAGRHFSSGADVPEIESLAASGEATVTALLQDNIASFLALGRLPYPVVAAIRGVCLGAGLELALACDFRVAERNALFSLPEVTYDIMPGCGGTIRLPRLIGVTKAVELILTGRSVDAEEAGAIGLTDRLVDKGQVIDAALALIRERGGRRPS